MALIAVPGIVLAGPISGTCTCTSFDNATDVVTGVETNWNVVNLKHNAGTLHEFVGNINAFPPGPIRGIAIRWNMGVFMNRPDSYFERLLKDAAKHNVRLTFTASDLKNVDGSQNLIAVAPAK